MRIFKTVSFWFLVLALTLSFWAGRSADTTYVVESRELAPSEFQEILETGGISEFITTDQSILWPLRNTNPAVAPAVITEQVVVETDEGPRYYQVDLFSHRGWWSLFPAFVTIVLCFLTREPVTALIGGVVSGALLLQEYDVTGSVMATGLATGTAANVILLYLIFLGGLLGIWSKNGGALAFGQFVTKRFVRGPKTAKLVAWALGASFFQGGSISSLLVGTTVKPVADAEKVSHEELSYVVDSTSSPIAVVLPFNAWPVYVQGLIFIGGVSVLATEADRISFFFDSIYLFFYAILAVLFTFLISIDKLPFIGPSFRAAVKRSRETGQLDRPGATPLQASGVAKNTVPEGYRPVAWEFLLPLCLIIGIAVGTNEFLGSPNVLWAFGIAIAVAFFCSILRGMSLKQVVEGFTTGLQSVVYGAVILLLAVVIGGLSSETGGGLFLVEALGGALPFWILPFALFVLTIIIAFATGTSWGTYAVTFPLAMPLAWATAVAGDMQSPILYLQICFAAVINGSVMGDQCSPISDTTVLSSISTGCDLMDHVRTQILPCVVAGVLAAIGWTLLSFTAA
ncbi:MAG: Na+/H+ antiporter NhaC family protein [Verrucomicrobiota bacterium]